MPKFTVEWGRHSRGVVTIEADTEEDAHCLFWDEYINGDRSMPPDREDWDSEVYPDA